VLQILPEHVKHVDGAAVRHGILRFLRVIIVVGGGVALRRGGGADLDFHLHLLVYFDLDAVERVAVVHGNGLGHHGHGVTDASDGRGGGGERGGGGAIG